MNEASFMGGMITGGILTTMYIIFAVWYVLRIIGYWKVFTKAGAAGWKSIIPIYSRFVQYDKTWKPIMAVVVIVLSAAGGIMMEICTGILMWIGVVITIAAIIFNTIGLSKLSKSFGHGGAFTVGLFFFEPLFTMILGFGKSQYIGNTTQE